MDLLKKCTYLLVMTIVITACKKDEEQIQKTIPLSAFHSIFINGAFEVDLMEQNESAIEILGSESFVNATKVELIDSVLTIENDKSYKWTRPNNNITKLIIKGMGIKVLHANESCQINSLNPITTKEFGIILKSKANTANIQLDNESFYYWNNFPCGGKLTLKGQTKEMKLWNTAIMSVDAIALECEYALVENDSKGDCLINVSQRLDFKINGEGNIVLYGNAESKDLGSSNSGRLIRR